MRLVDVLARRGALAPPEVVTLVVGLALDLADLHESSRAHGNVCAEAVWFEPSGRPRLTPPAGLGDPVADLMALAALGMEVLADFRPTGLVEALRAQVVDAHDLAVRVMASGPAAPVRLPSRGEFSGIERGHRPPTPGRLGLILVAAVALALNVPVPRPEPWRDVLIALDRARLEAVTDRSVNELRAVYDAGSPLLARDAALVRSLVRRGLTLQGRLATLTDPTPVGDTIVAAVERPASYVLVDSRGKIVLRVDTGQARRVVVRLRHTDAGWRVLDVR